MKNKIIEGDGPKRGPSFLVNVLRIIVVVVLWNLLLNAEFFQNIPTIVKIICLIVFFIFLETILQIILRVFSHKK